MRGNNRILCGLLIVIEGLFFLSAFLKIPHGILVIRYRSARADYHRHVHPGTGQVHVGYPPDKIVPGAGSEDVSLHVMIPKGKGWLRELRELFVGSTTYAVARRALRPLLIMNAK